MDTIKDCPPSLDDLLGAFATSFEVSTDPNRTEAPHPRFASYKNKSRTHDENQDERRRKRLQAQKSKRFDVIQKLRGSTDEEEELVSEHDDQTDVSMDMNGSLNGSTNSSQFGGRARKYKNALMMSEWLVDIPDDFETKWTLVLCPVGKRCLVVASQGVTKAYARNGYCFLNHFPSQIPGGNKRDVKKHKESCMLDCIYSESKKLFYILDVIAWNGVSLNNCETEFRFYWLNTKLKETKVASKVSPLNPYKFQVLTHLTCDKTSISQAVTEPLPFEDELDGLLFFHQECHYVSEVTPLVCWLKLDMICDVLNIELNEMVSKQIMQLQHQKMDTSTDAG